MRVPCHVIATDLLIDLLWDLLVTADLFIAAGRRGSAVVRVLHRVLLVILLVVVLLIVILLQNRGVDLVRGGAGCMLACFLGLLHEDRKKTGVRLRLCV